MIYIAQVHAHILTLIFWAVRL